MKFQKVLFPCILTLVLTSHVFSQEETLLSSIPSTEEEFIQSEKQVLATINWLENNPTDAQKEKRDNQKALLIAWITNSPTVTIALSASMIDFNQKNSDLLIYFMGGWIRYALENNYSEDTVQGTLAGLRSVIKVYNTGTFKKDKFVEKLIKKEEKGELESWVVSELN